MLKNVVLLSFQVVLAEKEISLAKTFCKNLSGFIWCSLFLYTKFCSPTVAQV